MLVNLMVMNYLHVFHLSKPFQDSMATGVWISENVQYYDNEKQCNQYSTTQHKSES